jgi:phosphatidylinositol N-acetylglucosaminyltransferase subunit A
VPSARIKIVSVSRLAYRKGVDLLIGIIPKICSRHSNVDFIVGGDGGKLTALQEMVDRERIQDRVEILGAVPHADVRDQLVRGHIFLNCSLTESFCIAILEAASCGLLVVSTNVGGIPEVLPNDLILLSNPNIQEMTQQLESAISTQQVSLSDSADTLSNDLHSDPWKTHTRIAQMYSWQFVAIETIKMYQHITDQCKRKSFGERLVLYSELGGFSGIVVVMIATTIELWLRFIEWYWPAEAIDVVPDLALAPICSNEEKLQQEITVPAPSAATSVETNERKDS